MTRMEQRYRRLLRVLPEAYRAAWEEEMVATFLASMATDDPDQAEYLADFGRPSWSEVASVLALAVRLRLGRDTGAVDSPRRPWGDAIRLIGLIGLLSQAALTTVWLGTLLWLSGRLPGLRPPQDGLVASATARWPVIRALLEFAAVPAYLFLLAGRYRIARTLAALGVVTMVVATLVDLAGGTRASLDTWSPVLVNALFVVALSAFLADTPAPRRRPWLVALSVAVGAVVALVVVTQHPATLVGIFLDWPALCCAAVVAGGAPVLVAAAARRTRPSARWSLALGLLGLVCLGQRLVTLPGFADSMPPDRHATALMVGLVEAALSLAVAAPLMAMSGPRGLPAAPATPDTPGTPATV